MLQGTHGSAGAMKYTRDHASEQLAWAMQWENHEASKDGKVAPFPVVNIDSGTAPLTQGNAGKVKDQRQGTTPRPLTAESLTP